MNAELHAQQQAFAAAIRQQSVLPVQALFKATPSGAAARFDIYANAYRIRLGEALKQNYPVLARVLGDDGFAELAGAYLSEHPSKKPSIRWFGATLHDFVAQHPDVLPHPALQDLIQMEWALSIAFDSADVALLPAGALLAVPADVWPVLRFTPQPALQLFAVGWNIEILWSALSADQDAETEAPVALDHHLLVWRVEHATRWRSVQQTEAALLQAAVAGADFARLCVLAQETSGDLAAQHVAGYLRLWLDAGLFCGFSQALRNEPDNLGIA